MNLKGAFFGLYCVIILQCTVQKHKKLSILVQGLMRCAIPAALVCKNVQKL